MFDKIFNGNGKLFGGIVFAGGLIGSAMGYAYTAGQQSGNLLVNIMVGLIITTFGLVLISE